MSDSQGGPPPGTASESNRRSWRGKRVRGGQQSRGSGKANRGEVRERPTHFISVPLDQLDGFTSQVAHMSNALLAASPPVTGLDPSIVISPPRLHLTLGVMALTESNTKGSSTRPRDPSAAQGSTDEAPSQEAQTVPRRTITDAIEFLQQLEPEIRQILQNQPLQLVLDELAVMRRSNTGEADVMYLGPSDMTMKTEEHAQTFKALQIVHNRFREAGFVTETRPLKLHCTILNTSHRRSGGRSGPWGVPFSMAEIDAVIAQSPGIAGQLLSSPHPLIVRKLNICRMGSYDSQGRYVSVGSVEW
ncbi:hypothetical protein BDV93DRAFT_529087 [Ceratobasidium sp. AG-I]|nr:hypothetical protein BDV93DRAFT_529087 [Ceratobasidium sp. AG-I]